MLIPDEPAPLLVHQQPSEQPPLVVMALPYICTSSAPPALLNAPLTVRSPIAFPGLLVTLDTTQRQELYIRMQLTQ